MHNNFERPYLSISKPKYNTNMEILHRYSLDNYKMGNQTNIQSEFSQKFSFADKMCDKIKLMMEHVSKTVTRLLENLNYLYQTNGIDYQVSQYYQTLMRLLTPHELLSHFHIQDNNQLFKGNEREKQKLTQCAFKQMYNLLNVRRKSTEQKFSSKQKNNISKFNISSMNNELSSINNPVQNRFWSEKLSNEKYNGGKPILGLSVQKQLAKWVLQQLGMSKILKMKDIAAKTKQFAYKYRGFKCSIGWVNRFLYRHPYLKQMMKLAKQRKFDQVKQLYFKVRRALQKEENEDNKTFNQQIMGQYTYPQFAETNGQAKQQNSQLSESYINSSAENNLLQSNQSEISLKQETPSEKKEKQELQQEFRYNYSKNEYNRTEDENRYKVHGQDKDEKEKKQKKSKFKMQSNQQNNESNEENENSIDNQKQQAFGQRKYLSLKDQSGKNYHASQKQISRRDETQKRRS